MNRSNTLSSFIAAALLVAAFAVAASAQTIGIGGKIYIQQADGTKTPLPNAVVKFYRIDIKQEFTTKSDKTGHYIYAGLPFVGTYTIVVSGPGAAPRYYSKIKASILPKPDSNDIVLDPGDGSSITLEQVNALEAAGGARAGTPGAATAASSAEAKKKAAELNAERKKIEEANAKASELNAKLPEIIKAGNEAFTAKNYDVAIQHYDEGISADPQQSVFYRNKAVALRARGVEKYNAGVKAKDQAVKDAARADFKASTETAEKALSAYREFKSKNASGGGSSPGGQAQSEELGYLDTRSESYRVALQTSAQIDNDAAAKAIEEYINAEPDQVKKDKAQSSLGDALFFAGRIDDSIAKFREVLAKNPNNLDAMFGLGISLAAKVVDANKDAPLLTEAHDMLQRFVAKAPEGYPRKQEATESVKYLEDTLKTNAASRTQDTNSNKGRTSTRRKP